MQLDKPNIIRLQGLDRLLFSRLRELCIGHDMLRSESYVSPYLKPIIGPFYALLRLLLRATGRGLADATSMHKHYDNSHFIELSIAVRRAAEKEVGCELSLVTALTHKARQGEFSSWHNGYYSPYIYNDNAEVLSVWVPLQSISPDTGSGFRFWYDKHIERKSKRLCIKRWNELDAKTRGSPADIVNPGNELRALYKLAQDSDVATDKYRCTCHALLGEAILFNEYWPHRTTKWRGDEVRLSIVLRFVKKGTGVNKMRLKKRKQALNLDGDEWIQYCTYISKIEG